MAKIIKKSSELEADYSFHRKKGKSFLLFALPGVGGIILSVLFIFFAVGIAAVLSSIFKVFGVSVIATGAVGIIGFVLFAISALYSFIMFAISIYHFNRAHIYGMGLAGESATADIIARLPAGFYGIQNVVVSFEGKKSELDMVVVGPTGVFVVETKNRNGEIRGNYEDRNWTQYKVGRGGTPYSNDFYSPVKQVGTHIYRLAHFLRGKGAKVHIDGAVYLSNPEADVYIGGTPGNIPVFSYSTGGETALLRYITSGNAQLDAETIGKVCKLLIK